MAASDPVRVSTTARHLLNEYCNFLCRFKVDPRQYRIDSYVLKDIAAHYWRDARRLHMFHKMPLIDCRKIAGYLAYWICKLRPISVASTSIYLTKPNTPKFINETFALYVVCGRINSELEAEGRKKGVVIEDKMLDALLYSLKYRITPGDMLSLFFEMAEKI
jgi:hypothetical protein